MLKGTFACVEGSLAVVAAVQRKISGDKRFMDRIGRSLCWPTDLAPFKPHTDVVILGSWHAPGGHATAEGRAGFSLGPIKKELTVLGPRLAVRESDGTEWIVTAPGLMTTLPLRWEYSAGALRDQRNPFGLGQDPLGPGRPIQVHMPQIQAVGAHHATPADRHPPANFAPVPPQFAGRRRLLGTRDLRWATFRAPFPPDDYDPAFHNAAPAGQMAGNRPRGDEGLTLHNMHPDHPVITTLLPNIRPLVACVVLDDGAPRTGMVALELDTIVCLPESLELVLVWRGFVPLAGEEELAGLACRTVPLGSDDAGADLPPSLLPHLPRPAPPLAAPQADELAADAAKRAAVAEQDTAAMLSEICKLASNPSVPKDIRSLLASETDLDKLTVVLQAKLQELVAKLPRSPPANG